MKFHFLYKDEALDIYSKGVNIHASNLLEACMTFEIEYSDKTLLAIFTENMVK